MIPNQNTHTFEFLLNYQTVTSILLILSLILNSLQSSIVYMDLFDEFTDKWVAYASNGCDNKFKLENCGDKKIVYIHQCPYHYLIYKTLELQPHYKLTLEFKFLRVDNNIPRIFIIYIDGQIVLQKLYNDSSESVGNCFFKDTYLLLPISFTIAHSSPSVIISMIAENASWGITEFKLSIKECSLGCNFCNSQECLNQELFLRLFNSKLFSTLNFQEGWQNDVSIVNQISQCFECNYLVSNGDNFYKVFHIVQHDMIGFQAKFLIFNSNSARFHIYIDDSFICDNISFQEINLFQYQHFETRLKIAIKVELIKMDPSYDESRQYIGIRDFQLFLSQRSFDHECFDYNIIPFDGCFSNNYDCIQGCRNCITGICYDCQFGWEFQEQQNSCIPYCGDSIITHDEECDDGNLIAYDGCHQCKYSCPKNCFYCQFGKCVECDYQHQLIDGKCQSIHDKLQKTQLIDHFLIREQFQSKQLDYHNFLENVCFFYFLDCRILEQQQTNHIFDIFGNFKMEQFQQSLECQEDYELDFYKKKCIPKCQDGILTSQEVCDDGNSIQFDGCYKCQQSCQIECLFCSQNKCYNCQEGWQLQDDQCKQICGDGHLAILSIEQCDDPLDPNCVECNYLCDHNCLVCDKFQNCEMCQNSFQMKDGKCLPNCGDSIISLLFEQCDDGNDVPYDGCYQCQYQCSFGCIKCEKDNHCRLCDEQFYILDNQTFKCQEIQYSNDQDIKEEINENQLLIVQCNENQAFINYECVNQCGNGMLNSHFEQCDDGNNNGGDGCSALCFLEDSYYCMNQEKIQSICAFVQAPNFELTLLSDIQDKTKTLELGFTQEVYLKSKNPFEQIVEFNITPQTQYELFLFPQTSISIQLSQPKYQISVQFLEPVIEPILHINIQKFSIYNQYDLELSTNTKLIHLGSPLILSEATQKRVNQIIKMNDAVVYSTVSFGGILFLTGNYLVFLNLLDLLQSLSYIRFIHYKFPPHLNQFLETYTKISLQPILDSLRVDELIARLNGGSIPYQGKEQKKSQQPNMLNQMYLINAQGCCLSYSVSLLTYSMCCLISSTKVSDILQQYFNKNQQNIRSLRLISKFQKNIQLQCSKVKNYYFSLGFYQLFYSTLQQLLFSTLLQFPEYTFNSIFEIVNSVVALSSLLFLIQMFLRLLSITMQQIKNKQKWKYFFQDSNTNFWAINFKPFQIYRAAFYITIIAKFIGFPEAQSVLLSMQSFFYLIYLIIFRPIKSKFELAKLICRELTLLIIIGSFLVYSMELNQAQFMLFGWLHIALFCFLLFFTLIADIFNQGFKAYQLRLKKLQKQETKPFMLQINNPQQKLGAKCNFGSKQEYEK